MMKTMLWSLYKPKEPSICLVMPQYKDQDSMTQDQDQSQGRKPQDKDQDNITQNQDQDQGSMPQDKYQGQNSMPQTKKQ